MNLVWIEGTLCPRIAWTLVQFLWQGAALAVAASLAVYALRGKSSWARYAIWTGGLGLMALCAPITFLLAPPATESSGSNQPPVAAGAVAQTNSNELALLTAAQPALDRPVAEPIAQSSALPLISESQSAPSATASPPAVAHPNFAPWIVGAYLAGVLALLARIVAGAMGGQRLCRSARPADEPAFVIAIKRHAEALGLRAAPAVAWCQQIAVPAVVGVWRPTVLLPVSLATGLTAKQVEIVLLHELAHLRRYDHVVHAAQRLIESLLFFHPAVWFVSRQMRVERENCCDDLVVRAGVSRHAYAESLVGVAELGLGLRRPLPAGALAAAGRPSALRERVLRILGVADTAPIRLRTGELAIAAALLLVVAIMSFTAMQPDLDAQEADSKPRGDKQGDEIPAGADMRLGSARYRMLGWKTQLAFAPDDSTVASLVHQKSIQFMDVATGKIVKEFSTGEQHAQVIRIAPDRRSAFTAGFEILPDSNRHTIIRWDLTTGMPLSTIEVSSVGDAFALELSSDAETLFAAYGGGQLRVFDVGTGDEVISEILGKGISNGLAVSPDGGLIVAGYNQSLVFWEWRAGKEPVVVPLKENLNTIAMSPDGKKIAAAVRAGAGKAEVQIRDTSTREVVHRATTPNREPMDVTSLVFSPNGNSLFGANSGTFTDFEPDLRIHEWDAHTGEWRRGFKCHADSARGIALSTDGRWLASAGLASFVPVWDLTSGQPLVEAAPAHEDVIAICQFSPSGESLLTVGVNGTMNVWDVERGEINCSAGHRNWTPSATYSPDGRWIASSSLDNSVVLWDAQTMQEVHRWPGHGNEGGRRVVLFSADGQRLISWGDDLQARTWDVKTGKTVGETRVSPRTGRADKDRDGADVKSSKSGIMIGYAAGSRDASRLVMSIDNDQIHVFNIKTGKKQSDLTNEGGNVIAAVFSPDARRIAISAWAKPVQTKLADGRVRSSAGVDHRVCVRDVETDKKLYEIKLGERGAGPAAFSPDGRLLAAVDNSADRCIHIVDAATGAPVQKIEGLPGPAASVCISPDGKRLACGMADGTTLIWTLK